MENKLPLKIINADNVFFSNRYLNSKALYINLFNSIPCVSFILDIKPEKALNAFKEHYSSMISSIYYYHEFTDKQKQYSFGETIIVLKNRIILVFDNNYCDILHEAETQEFATELLTFLKPYKQKQKEPLEMNLIVRSGEYLELKTMEIKKTTLNLDLFYEDDFKPVDEVIRKRLNSKNDKGIVLLHGLPGAGKTTYLRYLIGKIKKKVLFLPPDMAFGLLDPGFIDILLNNPNSVLVIEDAENIIMDRKTSSNASVSNLLNISDGLLADFLNIQLICTFNSSLTMIDTALLRKGRLIAKYEFGKLSKAKAQRLSDYFGFTTIINKPMTIAEIANQHEHEYATSNNEIIGFRKNFVER